MKHTCAKKISFLFFILVAALFGCSSRSAQTTDKFNSSPPPSQSEGEISEPVPQNETTQNEEPSSVTQDIPNSHDVPTELKKPEINTGLFKFGSNIVDSVLSSDGQLVAATTSEGHIEIFDLTRDSVTHKFKFTDKVKLARLSLKLKQLIVVFENNVIEIRTFPEGNIIKTISESQPIEKCILSQQENIMVITFANHTGDIYDLNTMEVLRSFQHQAKINDIVFSPNGTYVRSAGDDGTSLLFDLTESKLVSIYKPDTFNDIKKIQISSDDRYHAFINSEGHVEVVDITNSQKEISEVSMSDTTLHSPLQFHPNGQMYLRLGDEFILFNPLFHARTTEWFFQENSCPIKDLLLSPSGSSMLVNCGEGILNLFTTPMTPQEKPELLQTVTHVMPEIQSIWFHPHENFIIIVSKSGFILVTAFEEKQNLENTRASNQSLYIDPYSYVEEIEVMKEEDIPRIDYFGLSANNPHQHKLLGLAILVGGGLVYRQSLKVDAAAAKIGKLLKIADPHIRYARAERHFLNKGYSVREAQSKASKLIQSKPGLRGKFAHWGRRGGNLLKRGASKVIEFAAILSWFYGMAEAASEPQPTINPLLVVQEKQLEHLKKAFEELEISPLNEKIQKRYIFDLTEFLKKKSDLLKLDYRVAVAEVNSVLAAQGEFTEEKVQEAEKEFLEFSKKQTETIGFIDSVYETLRNVCMLETINAQDAQDLIDETLKRLSE